MSGDADLVWHEATPAGAVERRLRWQSANGTPAPRRVVLADDTLGADAAVRLASEGTALLWRSDYHNARQLLQAMARRLDRRTARKSSRQPPREADAAAGFHLHRQAQAQRARTLGMLIIPVEADYVIPLRRAPDVRAACAEAYGAAHGAFAVSLREMLGLIGAHEWRRQGVAIPALGGRRIHPYYGVFSPVRGEYLDLLAQAPLPAATLAFDVGTGTGVIAALLASRGVARVVATDCDARALDCARDNLQRLDFAERVDVVAADLFPPGRAPLVVCNPPWIPARPNAAIEHAIYDPDSRMLRGFLDGLTAHLEPGGEGWLIMSDLAEHLGLRAPDELPRMIAAVGLKVLARMETKPAHPRAADAGDPLHAARSREITSLWRLAAQ